MSALGLLLDLPPLGPAVGGAGIVYLAQDSFTGADGSALAAQWTVHRGTANITGNRFNTVANDGVKGDCVASLQAGSAAQDIAAVVRMTAAGTGIGIIGRFVDADNFWVLTPSLATGTMLLFENTAGVFTQRAVTAALGLSAGVDYTLRLWFTGNLIQGTINGGNLISFTSAVHAAATRAGIRSTGVANRADDFTVLPV